MSDANRPVVNNLPDSPLKDAHRNLDALYVRTLAHGVALKTMEGLLMAPRHASSQQVASMLRKSGAGKTVMLHRFEALNRISSKDAP